MSPYKDQHMPDNEAYRLLVKEIARSEDRDKEWRDSNAKLDKEWRDEIRTALSGQADRLEQIENQVRIANGRTYKNEAAIEMLKRERGLQPRAARSRSY